MKVSTRSFLAFALSSALTASLASAAAPAAKPSVQRFYKAFVSATKGVNQKNGRMTPAALGRVLAASAAVVDAHGNVMTRAAAQPAPHEVAAIKDITSKIAGNNVIDESEVEPIAQAFEAAGAITPGTADAQAFRTLLRSSSAATPNVKITSNDTEFDLRQLSRRNFPTVKTVTLDRAHAGGGPVILEVDPDRVNLDTSAVVALVGKAAFPIAASDVKVERGRVLVRNVPAGAKQLAFAYKTKAISITEGSGGLLRDGGSFQTLLWPSDVGKTGPGVSDPNDSQRSRFTAQTSGKAIVMNNASRRGGPAYNGALVVLDGYEKRDDAGAAGVPVELYSKAGSVSAATAREVLRSGKFGLGFFTRKFGQLPGFPNGKLRYVEALSDDFSMEHDGLVALAPSHLSDPKLPGFVAIHELAHHVFGNSIRVKNWDFWMSEGFAEYWTMRAVEEQKGPAHVSKLWKEMAFGANKYLSKTPHALVARPGTDVLTVFDRIPYSYGAWVLRQIEHKLGRAEFDTIMAKWVQQYRGKAADTRALATFLTKHNTQGIDFGAELTAWNALSQIPRAGITNVKLDAAKTTVTMDVNDGSKMPRGLTVPVRATLQNGTVETFDLDVSKRQGGFTHTFSGPVKKVEFDPERQSIVDLEVTRSRSRS